MKQLSLYRGALLALGAALLFGLSTPLAKLLLGGGLDPLLLAGLLYLGSGMGLALLALARRSGGTAPEAALVRADLPILGAVVLLGGVIGPVLLMFGLARTTASSAALLLNVEALATLAIAWILFREHVDRRLLLGAFAILAGAVLLSWQGDAGGLGPGALAVTGACIAWGIDNNLTRKLSAADPVQIAMIKGIVAGIVNTALALGSGSTLPGTTYLLACGILGFFGYGLSLVLFVLALRHLGSARTGAYFSTAPFIGAAVAIAFLGEPITAQWLGAAALMALGVLLHLLERHEHEHVHPALSHAHRHVHDEHHRHEHGADDPGGEPHSHWHRHAPLVHKHPHYPDLHHRHSHAASKR